MKITPLTKELFKQSVWSQNHEEVVRMFRSDIHRGLSNRDVEERITLFGKNIIEKKESTSALRVLSNQFKSPLIFLLVIAGIVTVFIDHIRDALFIFAAVLVNAGLGFYQEFKAEKAISELKSYLRQRARVVRDGKEQDIDATDLVPGDIVRLSQGDRVPADGRVLFVNDIQIDESILTGESLPVSKSVEPSAHNAVIADQESMVFAGTLVTQGVATVVVCRTDFSTEIGKIAQLVAESQREDTPLQGAIKRFSYKAGGILIFLTILIFFVGLYLGQSPIDMFLMSVAIAVSAVPEGLPIAMTVILAMGVQRMAKRKGVVRKLVAAEALGSTTLILTDKTGTLTMAHMEINAVIPEGNITEGELIQDALVNMSVVIENEEDHPHDWRLSGRALETAFVRSAGLRNVFLHEVRKNTTVLSTLPFNAVNKFSASLVSIDGSHVLVFLGAADVLVQFVSGDEREKERLNQIINERAEKGELVLGIAKKHISKKEDFDFSKDLVLEDLTFSGIITLRDPVRKTVKKAIEDVMRAGIRIVVMTGDHRGTAIAIAKEVGIHVTEEGVLDARTLHALSDEDFQKRLKTLSVLARVSPEDKLRLVKAFQKEGEIVAMTGDGVNDAPSIKSADIGIAMGSGTEVTRDVADLVLLDDNFETIAAAVEEGRQIMNNIRKVLVYLLSSVSDALLLIGGSIITGVPIPMNPLQILWVNFFSDSFPAIGYAFEKDDGLESSTSLRGKTHLFNPLMKFLILFIGFSTSALLFGLYWYMLRIGLDERTVRTFIFASFGTYSLFLALSVRSLDKSIFSYPFFSNRFMIGGVAVGIILMISAVYLPFLQSIFDTVPLPFVWALGVCVVGLLNIVLIECGKWYFRRKNKIVFSSI